MKKNILPLVILFIVLLIISADYCHAQVNKHIIILYDFSGSVLRQSTSVRRANSYLTHILCQDTLRNSDLKNEADYLENFLPNYDLPQPLFEIGDKLTFFSFGINNNGIASVTPRCTTAEVFLKVFAEELLEKHGSYPSEIENSELAEFLKKYYPTTRTKKFNYTFSHYALPLSMKLLPEICPEHTIYLIISDFSFGQDQSNINDQILIRQFFRPYLNAVKDFEANFNENYQLTTLLTLNIGEGDGITIKAVKVSTVNRPIVIARSDDNPKIVKTGVEEYKLSKMKFTFENLDNFRVKNRYLIVTFSEKNEIREYPTQFVKGSLAEGEVTIADLSFKKSTISTSEKNAILKLRLEGTLNKNSPFLSPLSTVIESKEITIPVLHAPDSGITGIILTIFGVIIVGGIAIWGFVLRKPKLIPIIAKNFERLNDEENTIVIEWANRIFEVPISIKNKSDILNFNYPALEICIDNPIIPEEYLDKLDMIVITKNGDGGYKKRNFGEDIKLGKLGPNQERKVFLRLNLGKFPEPDALTKPIRVTASYKVGENKDDIPLNELNLVIRKGLGPFWLGIDPGTSASCIAGGDQLNNIELVKFHDKYVIPSLVSIRPNYKMTGEKKGLIEYTDGIACGEEAALLMRANRERTFYSAKKLIGYKFKRDIQINGSTISVTGQDVVKILSDYLIKEASRFFKNQRQGVQINKAVVAIPNNFTPLKIRKMVDAVRSSSAIEKVYHVYEAEAVTLYYLSNYVTFNEKRTDKIPAGVRENILVFDFGGGTINVSIIGLTRPISRSSNTEIEIMARVGYAIGGETFDRIIAEIIWKKLGEVVEYLPNPFKPINEIKNELNETEFDDWWKIGLRIRELAEKTKIQLSDKNRLTNEQFIAKYGKDKSENLSFNTKSILPLDILSEDTKNIISRFDEQKFTVELEEVLQNEEIEIVLTRLEEAIESALQIYREEKFDSIHSLIFSGRSSFFPSVRSRIKQRIEKIQGQKPFCVEDMDEEQLKLAVAFGAAYYAAENQNITLSKNKTLANYGYIVINPMKHSAHTFKNIIPINTPFDEENDKAEKIDNTKQNIEHNNKVIRFYQVNCEKSKAEEIINKEEKVKYNQIAEKVEINSNEIQRLKLSINSKDKFEGEIDDGMGAIEISADIEINDILEDNDENTTWLLG
ncbi:MAG: Hsp70 family protein [Candidatus Lokiarchaeota archaeon]|nr:Hsp70 family protein [Candidatus Lokiarchaeota archaeon]